jgi:hypothetical protein
MNPETTTETTKRTYTVKMDSGSGQIVMQTTGRVVWVTPRPLMLRVGIIQAVHSDGVAFQPPVFTPGAIIDVEGLAARYHITTEEVDAASSTEEQPTEEEQPE